MLHACFAVGCSGLQYVAVCCSGTKWDAVWCSVMHLLLSSVLSVQHCATHCTTLQHTATHCNVLHHTETLCTTLQHTVTHCNSPQHIATHCNTLQVYLGGSSMVLLSALFSECNTLQPTVTHCNTLHHTTIHCNTLQVYLGGSSKVLISALLSEYNTLQLTATHCNALRHAATHCNTLQYTATHCNTLQHTATHCRCIYVDRLWFCSQLCLASARIVTRYVYVFHDSSIWLTWLIHMCDMTHSYVWHDSFIWVTWLIDTSVCDTRLDHICDKISHIRDMIHFSFTYDSFFIHTCDMTLQILVQLICSLCMRAVTYSYQWYDSFTRVTCPRNTQAIERSIY